MTAREEILNRIRTANRMARADRDPPIERGYRREGKLRPGSAEVLDLLADRLIDYRAEVRRMGETELPAAIGTVLHDVAGHGARIVVPQGLPADWAPQATTDNGSLSAKDLDEFQAVVTECAAAGADTGTIVLDGSPGQGRRALTLVPDLHVCVVRAGQVVETIPELLALLDPRRPLTFISGPSATSDIELERVEGVHGPRTLCVLLVSDATA